MSESDRLEEPSRSVRRGQRPLRHAGAFLHSRIGPSPELLAALRENPGVDIGIRFPGDPGGGSAAGAGSPALTMEMGATAENVGCPYCEADFSVAYLRDDSTDVSDKRDLAVICPACRADVMVAVPGAVHGEAVVVGPARTRAVGATILRRAGALRAADPSLGVVHSEQIAALELERDEWRETARRDAGTGLLNERAHMADAKEPDRGHVVLHLPPVEAVYDHCGQASGNQYARDAARIIELAAGANVRVYRLGTAKFALLTADFETARRISEAVNDAMRSAVSSVVVAEASGTSTDPAGSIEDFLARHPTPFGLAVRLRWERGRAANHP